MINYHYCADCDIAWEDEWDCACDDECPGCHRDFTPFYSEEERDAAQDAAAAEPYGGWDHDGDNNDD